VIVASKSDDLMCVTNAVKTKPLEARVKASTLDKSEVFADPKLLITDLAYRPTFTNHIAKGSLTVRAAAMRI
jgi:hypothetical protein